MQYFYKKNNAQSMLAALAMGYGPRFCQNPTFIPSEIIRFKVDTTINIFNIVCNLVLNTLNDMLLNIVIDKSSYNLFS